MSLIINKISLYLEYPFVRYAFIVSILIALCSALFGVVLVLKRFSFIGDGLSHVAFGAMSIATILNIKYEMPFVIFFTTLIAILLLCAKRNIKIKGDAIIAMISVASLAIGYLLMNIFAVSANLSGDVCTTLFGSVSILTLTSDDVYLCIVLSSIIIIIYLLFYNKIFAITFDEDFSKACGLNITFYNFLIAIVIAIIIVLAMNLVGSLLISALVIFPALSAMRLFKSFKSVSICAAIFSVLCVLFGLLIAILFGTPVGSTIVVVQIVLFIISYLTGLFIR